MSTWVLLRGLTRERRHWGDFPALLQEAFPDARIFALDLPGNGTLRHAPSLMAIGQMAQCCRTQLRRRGAAPPYHLLALSLGAMVAVAFAEAFPEETGACVLINTSLRPFNPVYWRLRPHSYPALLRLALAPQSAEAREQLIYRLTSNRPTRARTIVGDWIRYHREQPVSAVNALRQLYAALTYRAPAQPPTSRMLLLASGGDVLVDVRCSRRLAERWRVPLVEHPDAGHDLPLDDGPWVVRQVKCWLAAGGGRGEATPVGR
ncbi:MAG: alpha/beta fold hydrolase [Pseudomonadota bacterium]